MSASETKTQRSRDRPAAKARMVGGGGAPYRKYACANNYKNVIIIIIQQPKHRGTPLQSLTFVTFPVIVNEAVSLSSTPPVATTVYWPGNT